MNEDKVWLVFKVGGQAAPVGMGTRVVVGRHPGCDLRLHDRDVSKVHCAFALTEDGLTVSDLGSRNGTFLNGRPVQAATVRDGDEVRVGGTGLVARISGGDGLTLAGRISALVPNANHPFLMSVEALGAFSKEIDLLEKQARARIARPNDVSTQEQFAAVEAMRATHRKLGELKAYRDKVIQIRERSKVALAAARAAGRICGADEAVFFLAGPDGLLERKAEAQRVVSAGEVSVPRTLLDSAAQSQAEAFSDRGMVVPIVDEAEVRGALYCAGTQQPQAFSAEDAALLREVGRIALAVLEEC